MKIKHFCLAALTVTCTITILTGCTDIDDNPTPVTTGSTEHLSVPTEDALSVTTNHAYVMYGKWDEEVGYALGRRLQGTVTSPMNADVFIIDPTSIESMNIHDHELKTIIRRTEKGEASIVMPMATFREFYDWSQLYIKGCQLIEKENYQGDLDDDSPQTALAHRKMAGIVRNAYMAGQSQTEQTRTTVNGLELDWEHVDTWPVEKQNAVMFDGFAQSGDHELFVMNAAAALNANSEVRHPQSDYEWGHKADAVVHWLNSKSGEKAQSRAGLKHFAQSVTRADGNAAISDLISAQTKEFVFDLKYQSLFGYYTDIAYSALKVQYAVYSAYDFGGNVEYYQVRQNITVMNDKIYSLPAGDSWWVRNNDANFNISRGAWMKYIDTKMWLEGSGTKSVISAAPLNENGSSSGSSSSGGGTTHTVGATDGYSIGGSVGMSGLNPTFSITASGTHTDTYSDATSTTWNTSTNWSTKDLTTTFTQGNDANGTVAWTHTGNTPTNGNEAHVSKLKPLLINTCVTDEQALWKIDNPSGTYTLKANFNVQNEIILLNTINNNSAFLTKDNPHEISFELNAPNRYKRKWNNVIYDYGTVNGDIQLTSALDNFIETSYGNNSANFCWATLFVSTEATANGSDNARAVFQTFKNSIVGMKQQLRTKGYGGRMVFGLKVDGQQELVDSIAIHLDNDGPDENAGVPYNEGETFTEMLNGYDLTYKVTKKGQEVELDNVPEDFSGELNIPEKVNNGSLVVTSLGDNCAVGRKGITAITIPTTVRTIETGALAELNIAEINIPEGVQTIGTWSFHADKNLTKIYLPNSLTAIQGCTFYECNAISEIHIKATMPPDLGNLIFYPRYNDAVLYVPKGCKDAYAKAKEWLYFKNIVEE